MGFRAQQDGSQVMEWVSLVFGCILGFEMAWKFENPKKQAVI